MKKLMLEIYRDTTQPAAKVVGAAVGDVAGMIAEPIGRAAQILRKNMTRYVERMEGEKPEETRPVRPDVAMPIMQKLLYTEQEELARRYIEMLAKESLASTQGTVLPSFFQILSELSPDEVRIIDGLINEQAVLSVPAQDISEKQKKMLADILSKQPLPSAGMIFLQHDFLPYLKIGGEYLHHDVMEIYHAHFNNVEEIFRLDAPENKDVYLVNLARLGLLVHNSEATIDVLYEQLQKRPDFKKIEAKIKASGQKMRTKKGRFAPTDLAKRFVAICSPTPKKEAQTQGSENGDSAKSAD